MMDLTDGNTRETAIARGATTDFTLGGYTRAIAEGKHPVWGSQRTAQLNDVTGAQSQLNAAVEADITAAVEPDARQSADDTLGGYTRALEQGSHPVWGSQGAAQLQEEPADRRNAAAKGTPNSVRKGRQSMMGRSPSALKRAQPEGQRSKWGFVPGEDDTLDLNLEKAGERLGCMH